MASETTVRTGPGAGAGTAPGAGRLAAADHARQAAGSAGVRIDELHRLAGLSQAAALYRAVWDSPGAAAPVSPELMRALSHAGGYVAGAYEGEQLVAASVGFVTQDDGHGPGLHSHISAVLPSVQGRSVGRALKLHQRSWALEHDLATVSWTYDPLLCRNAWFNLTRLGAQAVDYLVDFYGVLDDAQNVGDASDRLVALWTLDAPAVVAAARGVAAAEPDVADLLRDGAVVGLRAVDGEPVPLDLPTAPARAPRVLVQLPRDVQALRRTDPDLARRWRESSRDVLLPLLSGPYDATGFTRSGWYLLEERPA